jgi:hypothetical protein
MPGIYGTHAGRFVKHPQHSPENTASGMGTPNPNGVYVHAGYDSQITEGGTTEHDDAAVFAKYDLVASALLGINYNWGLTFRPLPTDFSLVSWGVNSPNGAGTIDEAKTFLYSQKVGTAQAEKYKKWIGCIPTSTSWEIQRTGAVVTMTGRATSITDYTSTHGLTSPTFASDPAFSSNPPVTGTNSGSNPLNVGGNNFDTPRFRMDVNWTVAELRPNGIISIQEIGVTARRITLEFVTWTKGDTFLADLNSYTPVSVTYKVSNSPLYKLEFTNCYKISYDKTDSPGGEFTTERVGMIALGVVAG